MRILPRGARMTTEQRYRLLRRLVDRQTAHSHPIIGTPTDVPVPRKVNVRGPLPDVACESITPVFHRLTHTATRPRETPGERAPRAIAINTLPWEDAFPGDG